MYIYIYKFLVKYSDIFCILLFKWYRTPMNQPLNLACAGSGLDGPADATRDGLEGPLRHGAVAP